MSDDHKGATAHYALLESGNPEVADLAEAIPDDEVASEDGTDILLRTMREVIMPRNTYEKYLQFEHTFFATEKNKKEAYQAHGVRVKTAFTKLSALGVAMDPKIQGFFLLRQTGLSSTERMSVMLQTQVSLRYDKVADTFKGLRYDSALAKLQDAHRTAGQGPRPRVFQV